VGERAALRSVANRVRAWRNHGFLAWSPCGANAGPKSLLIEIAFLILVAVLHNRLPSVAGTLGFLRCGDAAASFPQVESWAYGSVMATTNLIRLTASSSQLQGAVTRIASGGSR
jgi:uncharacterized membrane protein YoaK (UPF0700 family)